MPGRPAPVRPSHPSRCPGRAPAPDRPPTSPAPPQARSTRREAPRVAAMPCSHHCCLRAVARRSVEGSDEGEFPVRTDGCRCAQRPSGLLSHSGRCEAPTQGVTCACSGLAPQLDLHGRLDSVCRGRPRHGGAVSVPHPATAPPGPHPFPPACPHLPPRRTTAGPTRLPQHKL